MLEDAIEARQGDDLLASSEERVRVGWSSWIVLVMLALVPVVFATGFSNFERFRTLLMGVGGGAALLMWGVALLRARPLSMVAGRVNILLLAFGLYVCLSLAWAPEFMSAALGVSHWLALIAVVLVIVAPVGRPLRFLDFAMAVALGVGGSGAIGLLDLAGIRAITPIWNPPGAAGGFDALSFATAYYVVALPIVMGGIARQTGRMRILFGACFLLGGLHFGVAAGWLFAGIFGVACMGIALLIAVFQRTASLLALTPVFALIGLLALMVLGGQVAFEQPAPSNDATSLPLIHERTEISLESLEDRNVRNAVFSIDRMEAPAGLDASAYLLGVGTELFAENPIVGHGAESWWQIQTRAVRGDDPYVRGMFEIYPAFKSPHNGLVKIAVEYGVIGLLLFVLWFGGVLWITVSALTYRSEQVAWLVEHWALLTTFVVGIIFMCITPLIELNASSLVWIASLAMLTRASAAMNDFRDWSSVWSLHTATGGGKRFALAGGVAALLGIAIIVPVMFSTVSSYYRAFADNLMLRAQYARAIPEYEKALGWYPNNGDVLYNIALAKYRSAIPNEKGDELDQALELRPNDARVLYLASVRELKRSDHIASTALARRAIAANPNDIYSYRTLAASLQMLGRFDESAVVLQQAIDRTPPQAMLADLHLRLGEIYESSLDQPRKAIDQLKIAQQLLAPGFVRTQLSDRIGELEKRLERERLMREGKPVPAHLMPTEDPHEH